MLNSSTKIAFYYLIQRKPYYTLVLFLLSSLGTVGNVLGTILLIPIFSLLIDGETTLFSHRSFLPFDYLFTQPNRQTQLLCLIISLFVLILVKNIANYGSRIISFKHTKSIAFDLKNRGIELLCNVDFDYYQKHKPAEILAKFNRDIDKASLAVKGIQKLAIIAAIATIITGILLIIAWQLTLLSFIAVGSIIWTKNYLKFQATKQRNASIESSQAANRRSIEFLLGIRTLKLLANETKASLEISQSLNIKHRQQLQTQLISATIEPMTEIGGMLTIFALVGITFASQGLTTAVEATRLLIFLAVLLRLLPFVDRFNRVRLQYLDTRSSLTIVADFLNPHQPLADSEHLRLVELGRGIEFRAVSFAYPNHGQIILDRIDLSIYPQQTIALVGFPSKGNSPITDLLARLYDPIDGKILLDGKEINEYDPRSLRKAIAVVSYQTFLFDLSLAENIAYGVDNVSYEEIVTAAKQAQIYHFIAQLPAGLSTQVGDRGVVLSPAQRLKIGLARAFLRQPQILILDEPLALLDSVLDLESIRPIIYALTRRYTTIIITKQLDLAQTAERIFLFDRGKIIEAGTHQQLLQRGNVYPQLYSQDFKTNQQPRQIKLAQKIARKLARQNKDYLSPEIRLNLSNLIDCLDSLSQGWSGNESQIELLDESFQSAKDMLANLKAYDRQISRGQLDS